MYWVFSRFPKAVFSDSFRRLRYTCILFRPHLIPEMMKNVKHTHDFYFNLYRQTSLVYWTSLLWVWTPFYWSIIWTWLFYYVCKCKHVSNIVFSYPVDCFQKTQMIFHSSLLLNLTVASSLSVCLLPSVPLSASSFLCLSGMSLSLSHIPAYYSCIYTHTQAHTHTHTQIQGLIMQECAVFL